MTPGRIVRGVWWRCRRLTHRIAVVLFVWVQHHAPRQWMMRFGISPVICRRFPVSAATVLFRLGQYREVVAVYDRSIEALSQDGAIGRACALADWAARAYFELAAFDAARRVCDRFAAFDRSDVPHGFVHLRAILHLVLDDERDVARMLDYAATGLPHLQRPHQNLAARDSMDYVSTALDAAAGELGRIYDACNFAGQRVTHVGEGQIGTRLYARALDAQRRLRLALPTLSPALSQQLADWQIGLDELRVLGSEWVTQIGHLGMLDIQLRMRALGWWLGTPVLLATRELIANPFFLSLFRDRVRLVVLGDTVADAVGRELVSLQRYSGLTFNAFALPSGEVVPWQEAGALAIRQWEAERRADPLREQFDCAEKGAGQASAALERAKRSWGMLPGDWYVCLHMREPSHYNEVEGSGQTHRNAAVDGYIDAIRYITARGGWVVHMGSAGAEPMPEMLRVVDYCRGPLKSAAMDIQLIRHARFFIGTTSGLTNVAISFGLPCALVNCITTDAQLWHGRVRFALKRIERADGGYASQYELTTTPWRWRLFDADVLRRHGARAIDNGPDEILEVVKQVDALATGNESDYLASFSDAGSLLTHWHSTLGLPYFYGGAQPGIHFLTKNRETLLPRWSKIENQDPTAYRQAGAQPSDRRFAAPAGVDNESRRGLRGFFAAFFGLCAAVAGLVVWWGTNGRDHFAAIPLNGDRGWYRDFAGRYVPEIQDLDLFYHNIGQSVAQAKDADVILLGPSFVLFAMDDAQIQEFARRHGIKIYDMAFLGVRSGEFARELIVRWNIRPKLWVINVDDQFTPYFSRSLDLTIGPHSEPVPAATYGRFHGFLAVASRNLRWRAQDAVAYLSQRGAVALLPEIGFYRNIADGSLDLRDNAAYMSLDHKTIQVTRNQDCHTNPQTIAVGQDYLHDIGGRAVFMLVPHSEYCPAQARELGAALGRETIVPPSADYTTIDGGGHLDARGSEAFTQFFLEQLEKTEAFKAIAPR